MLLVKLISLKLFLRTAHENVVSSELVVRDAHRAAEIRNFAREQILVEALTVICLQGNKSSLHILKLFIKFSLALFPKRTDFT